MENCSSLHENLFAYLEKELPATHLQQLDVHVGECAECAALVADFKSILVLMEEQKSVEPKPFAETRIIQALESRLEKKQKSLTPVFVRILQPAFVSMGFIAAVAIGFLIGSDYADSIQNYSQNEDLTESVRSELNVPEFMSDDIFYFSE